MSTTSDSHSGVATTHGFTGWTNRPEVPYDCPCCNDQAVEHTRQKRNETKFDPKEAPPSKRSLYRRLDLHNRDAYVGREDLRVWEKMDIEYHDGLIKGLASQLSLSENQIRFAVNLYNAVDRQQIGRWSELIGFCCCILALDNGDTDREYHPSRKAENNDPQFGRLADWLVERFPIDKWAIVSVLNKIEDRHL